MLTDKKLKALKAREDAWYEVADGRTGLAIRVNKGGAKSWVLRYRDGKRLVRVLLGASYPETGLARARELATEARKRLADGHAAVEAKAKKDTVEEVVEDFLARYGASRYKPRTLGDVRRTLRAEVAKPWKGRTLAGIQRRDVLDLLDAIIDRGTPIRANRVKAYLSVLLKWAVERGILQDNPMAGLRTPAKERRRDRVLSDAELRAVWTAAGTLTYPWGPLARLLAVTGQRLSEVAGMRWEDIDERGVWSVRDPKNDQPHRVPLPALALEVLETCKTEDGKAGRGGAWVLSTTAKGPVSGFSKAKKLLDDELLDDEKRSRVAPWTYHDLRRTAASGMARVGVSPYTVERVLNHVLGGVQATYQHYTFEREIGAALATWSAHVASLVGDSAEVVALRSVS